jgi:hypothetical protein
VVAGFYRDGTLNPRPRVDVLHETDGAILFDGDRGGGPGLPTRAMRWCIERARERKGMAVVAVRDWQIDLRPGTALTIPVGTAFQFRNTGFEPLAAVGVTMPPWPGEDEAMDVAGPWAPQLTA